MVANECDIDFIADTYEEVVETTQRFVVGNRPLIELIFIGLLSEGAVLIEGVPGTAKTTVSKIMAKLLSYSFKRVQGAVDVQPADIIGVRIYVADESQFVLQKGPIFSNFVLVDEINRLTPKTQSALLESMSEHQATIDGNTYPLPKPFFVIATQNPYEFEGTFSLVEAQRDRFMYSIPLTHLGVEDELEIIRRDNAGGLNWTDYEESIPPLLTNEDVGQMITEVRSIRSDDAVMHYIADIVAATREHADVRLGASSRASLALLRGAKVHAAIDHRDYVIPDDVKSLASPVLRHRILLEREAILGQVSVDTVIAEILDSVEVS
ncbi:AAA family ATPase [Methanofollis fontis]|uniref:ATPase n=1 Tax=Methanofollis fontis TaxID=2052832 RepID=A0A483CSJ7_9EURY|nr:MoxR family ATPase [Methanofollis fontis]TAJ45314.1 ATPase [Methanofollis fontis]